MMEEKLRPIFKKKFWVGAVCFSVIPIAAILMLTVFLLSYFDVMPIFHMRTIHEKLRLFMEQYDPIFRDESATASYTAATSRYHGMLRSQLAAPIRKFCRDDFTAEFIAEAMLSWTVAGKDFDELKAVLLRIN
jgi:hypothetical protein